MPTRHIAGVVAIPKHKKMNNIAILVDRNLAKVKSTTIYCDVLTPSELEKLKEKFIVEDLGLGNYKFIRKNGKK